MLTMPIVAAVKRTASLNDLDCRQLMPNRFVKLLDVKEALKTLIYDPVENLQAKQNINASSQKGDMSSSSSQESVVVSDDVDSINTIGLNEMSADESEDMIAASGTQCLDSQKTVEQQTNDYTDNLTSQIESEPMIELSTSLIETDFPERCLESANDEYLIPQVSDERVEEYPNMLNMDILSAHVGFEDFFQSNLHDLGASDSDTLIERQEQEEMNVSADGEGIEAPAEQIILANATNNDIRLEDDDDDDDDDDEYIPNKVDQSRCYAAQYDLFKKNSISQALKIVDHEGLSEEEATLIASFFTTLHCYLTDFELQYESDFIDNEKYQAFVNRMKEKRDEFMNQEEEVGQENEEEKWNEPLDQKFLIEYVEAFTINFLFLLILFY